MTEQKKYHKVFVGRYHRDNKAPSFLKCSTQNMFSNLSIRIPAETVGSHN